MTAVSRRSFLLGSALLGTLLAGCSSPSADDSDSAGNAAQAADSSESSQDAAASGTVLVAYYSAQGHTEAVAQMLADELGADLFEIMPEEPYTDDDLNWNDDESRVSVEHEDESQRDVPLAQATPDNWESYDTVLLGYPIWWGIAAWPTNGFASGNDFSGKTVIPFCTSASSPIGSSGEQLAELAGTGDWQEGRRFSSSASEDDVVAWAQSL